MILPYFVAIRQKEVAIIEVWGKFSQIRTAGLYLVKPWEAVAGRLTLKVQEMQVNVETKFSHDATALIRELDTYIGWSRAAKASGATTASIALWNGHAPTPPPYDPWMSCSARTPMDPS